MKKRIDSLARIGRLASQMSDLGRWRLSAIEREQAGLSDDLRAVCEALEGGDFAYGAQARFGAHRLRTLQHRIDQLARQSAEVSGAARVHRLRAKLAAQAADAAKKAWADKEARKELIEMVERTLPRRDASQG